MAQPSVNTQSEPEIQPYPLPIAGFWKRFFASFLDLTVLSVFLLVITLIFRGFFFALGPYGRLLGWGVSVAYFTYTIRTQEMDKHWANVQLTLRYVTSLGNL